MFWMLVCVQGPAGRYLPRRVMLGFQKCWHQHFMEDAFVSVWHSAISLRLVICMCKACWGWDWGVVNPDLSHSSTPDSMTAFVCSSNMRLNSLTKPNKILHSYTDEQPEARPPLCATLSFSRGLGHKNQSADHKLCRSMCSSVREAQCFSLDLALAKLA